MAAYDYVFHLEINDSMLYCSFAGQITIDNHAADISVLKHLVGKEIEDGRFPIVTVAAANPQNLFGWPLKAGYEICADRLSYTL